MNEALGPLQPPDSEAFARAARAQAVAADPAHSAWVAANAGAGKTKVLIDRVARLLLRGAEPDSILCVTYTRAAANEMLSRLFDRLGDWSVMETAALRDKLAELEDRPPASYTDEELRHARALFARALETPGGLRIETIHAFCARVLRRFPLEARIAPGFRDLEEDEARRLWQTAGEAALLALDAADPETLAAIARIGGAYGASAGLGAAKSAAGALAAFARAHDHDLAAMTAVLRAGLGAPDEPSEVLLARAMGAEFPEADYRAAWQALRAGQGKSDQASAAVIEAALNVPDPAARWTALQPLLRTANGAPRKNNPYTAPTVKAAPLLADLFEIAPEEGRETARLKAFETALSSAQAVERTRDLFALALPALRAYADAKRARAALDFDDLIAATARLLTRSGLAPWVLYKLDGGLTHLLLDEAQDTSPAQWRLLHTLTAEFFSGEGAERAQDPRTLFVVGDEKQSIYSFQGADPDGFQAERQAFIARAPQGASPDMTMSFRSSPEILTFVDEVFDTEAFDGASPFSIHPPPEADRIHHEARRANQPGLVELWPLAEPEADALADPWDAPLDALPATSPKARLAREVAAAIKAMIERGETIWAEQPDRSWQRRAMRPEDVLILVRSRKGGLFDSLIDALKREGLPVAGADRLTLTDHLGVQDCLNLMRIALFPGDDLTLAEILRGPFCGLTDDNRHLFPLAHARGDATLWQRLKASDALVHGPARDFIAGLIEARHLPAFEFLSRVLDRPHLDGETGWDRLGARLGMPVRDPVEALLARALAHDGRGPASLQAFLAAMDRDVSEIKRDLAGADGAVRVMTVHGAKGLQAPLVVLPDTTSAPSADRPAVLDVDGLPVWAPSARGDTDKLAAARQMAADKALREHRRLLYVALTRAQDRLIIAGAWHGGPRNASGRAKGAWYTLCEAALERLGVPEAEPGSPRRHGDEPPRLKDAAREASTEAPPLPAWLKRPAPAETARLTAVSPSGLLHDRAPVLRPGGEGCARRLRRGQLVHDLLQRLPELPEDARRAAAEAWLAATPGLDPKDAAEIARTVLTTLAHPDFAALFGPNARAEAAIIGAGTGWPTGTVINGRVDRLLVTENEVLVVDIKTDRPPPADETGVAPAYLAQMAAYQNVLAAAYPGRPVRCALLWTDGPRLMPLGDELLLAHLKRGQSRVLTGAPSPYY